MMGQDNERADLVLVVDDDLANLSTASDLLETMKLRVMAATSGEEALRKVAQQAPDLILLDVMMPGIDGYEVCRQLKAHSETKHIPIIMLTALDGVEDHVKAMESGADDFLNKPFTPAIMQVRLQRFLREKHMHDELEENRKYLEQKVRFQTRVIQRVQDVVTYSLSKLVEYRDPETGAHLERIRHYSMLLSSKMLASEGHREIDGNYINSIFRASILHDIGKVGIRDDILLKPGKLTVDEFEIMKMHCEIGGKALEEACSRLGKDQLEERFLMMARDIAFCHHEKYNGSGYPRKLAGKDIPLAGRIVAVADVFDALVSRRPYKEPLPVDKAIEIVKEGKGAHFDPDIVECFVENLDSVREIAERFSDDSIALAP